MLSDVVVNLSTSAIPPIHSAEPCKIASFPLILAVDTAAVASISVDSISDFVVQPPALSSVPDHMLVTPPEAVPCNFPVHATATPAFAAIHDPADISTMSTQTSDGINPIAFVETQIENLNLLLGHLKASQIAKPAPKDPFTTTNLALREQVDDLKGQNLAMAEKTRALEDICSQMSEDLSQERRKLSDLRSSLRRLFHFLRIPELRSLESADPNAIDPIMVMLAQTVDYAGFDATAFHDDVAKLIVQQLREC